MQASLTDGMELALERRLLTRLAGDAQRSVILLEEAVEVMQTRTQRLAGKTRQHTATPTTAPRLRLQRLSATATGGFAVLIDHPAAVLCAAVIFISPFAAEFLVDGEALRVAEVDFTAGADIRGHEALPSR